MRFQRLLFWAKICHFGPLLQSTGSSTVSGKPTAGCVTDPLSINEFRAYWLTTTPAKRLPPSEPERLEVDVKRAFATTVPSTGPFAGQVRPTKVKIDIDVRGHRELFAPREASFRTVMRVVDQEASWDRDANRVRFGGGYIEVLCPQLLGFGFGSLFMNLAIGWAMCFHPDARVHEIKIGNDARRTDRSRFYEAFGFRFDGRGDATGNLLSEPMRVADLRVRPHRLIESEANFKAAAGLR